MPETHEMTIRVRYCETDGQGVLHHSHYFNYFEMGRTELFRAQGGDYRAMEQEGLFFVVARIRCQYHKPARYDDLLRLRTTVCRVSQARLEHEYALYRGEELLATGHSVLACLDGNGAVQRIPAVLDRVLRRDRQD